MFEGSHQFRVLPGEEFPHETPSHVRVVDSENLVPVNEDRMALEGDGGRLVLKLREASAPLHPKTAHVFRWVILHALNGKRKVSTIGRWTGEFVRFVHNVRTHTRYPIGTITKAMFDWYTSEKNPSQQKLLRSFLKFWMDAAAPGIDEDLKSWLSVSRAPKPRSSSEIQNAVPRERPFSVAETREILSIIEKLYIDKEFDEQDYLLWRLIISEAMRPSQMRLLQVRDVKIIRSSDEGSPVVEMKVPIVKQKATPGRRYMVSHRLSESVARAVVGHLDYVRALYGEALPAELPLFCVKNNDGVKAVDRQGWQVVHHYVNKTRTKIALHDDKLAELDLFTRRFKHTKLTHLAMLGAPLEVLAKAGFQTSKVSLRHYVNLTEEAFQEYELAMVSSHANLATAFKGSVIEREQSTNKSHEHDILEPNMEGEVGSCSDSPCTVVAPFGCYLCRRFQAFRDGPHHLVRDALLERKSRAIRMGLSSEAVTRDDHIIAAVEAVIAQVEAERGHG